MEMFNHILDKRQVKILSIIDLNEVNCFSSFKINVVSIFHSSNCHSRRALKVSDLLTQIVQL